MEEYERLRFEMKRDHYQIKRMTRGDLDIAISWAEKEGWNPGLYDRDCFFNTDREWIFRKRYTNISGCTGSQSSCHRFNQTS